jgi:Family of unknown function (DUF6518)
VDDVTGSAKAHGNARGDAASAGAGALREKAALRDDNASQKDVSPGGRRLRLNRLRLLVLALVVGLAVGALTSILQKYLDSPWLALVNSASPWLAPAFAVGAAGRRVRDSALAGFVACAAELLGYYATAELRGFPAGDGILLFWTVCGVIGGPLFGAAGLLWREGSGRLRGLGPALLGGAFLAEAGISYGWTLHYYSSAVLFAAIGVAAVAVLGFRARQHARAGLWLLATLPVGALGEIALGLVYTSSF